MLLVKVIPIPIPIIPHFGPKVNSFNCVFEKMYNYTSLPRISSVTSLSLIREAFGRWYKRPLPALTEEYKPTISTISPSLYSSWGHGAAIRASYLFIVAIHTTLV